jgi:hypothetical protein
MATSMDEFIPIILGMFKNPPDPNAPIPVGNRASTVYGVTMPFHVSIHDAFDGPL